jgi:hypothetical protein
MIELLGKIDLILGFGFAFFNIQIYSTERPLGAVGGVVSPPKQAVLPAKPALDRAKVEAVTAPAVRLSQPEVFASGNATVQASMAALPLTASSKMLAP